MAWYKLCSGIAIRPAATCARVKTQVACELKLKGL